MKTNVRLKEEKKDKLSNPNCDKHSSEGRSKVILTQFITLKLLEISYAIFLWVGSTFEKVFFTLGNVHFISF